MEKKARKERLKTFYRVDDDFYGQRGTSVDEVKMTESEYRRLTCIPRRGFSLFRTYAAALYYTQD